MGDRAGRALTRADAWPLGAIAFVLVVSAAWWLLALWPAAGAPAWLERTRSVCFNITDAGLPDAKGWLLLIGQPPAMLATLWVGWSREVRASIGRLCAGTLGRSIALAVVGTVGVGFALAAGRVHAARSTTVVVGTEEPASPGHPRLDRRWPDSPGLLDHHGEPFTLASLKGRPAFVTFAFGSCETVCPVIVHQAKAARAEVDVPTSVVVFTLDPWRDTPGRLASMAARFDLDQEEDFVVGGAVEQVEQALDAWGVTRERDLRSGDITHAALVYLVERDGTIAYIANGGVTQLVSLARRLR